MQEINDRTQELSVAQRSQADDPSGCPTCGRPILAVERRGPSTVIISPCGHDVSETFARDFPREPKRVATDGGELTCEVTESDEHDDDVKIVLDDAGDVLAMCAQCRQEFGYQRVIDEDPEAAICDGGVDIDWDSYGYVSASDHRTSIVGALHEQGPASSSTLSERTGLAITHVSRTLTDLREHSIVELLVPEERNKGRIYGLTDDGDAVAGKVTEGDS